MKRTERVPEDQGKVVPLLPLLAQLEQRPLPRVGAHEIHNQIVHLLVLTLSLSVSWDAPWLDQRRRDGTRSSAQQELPSLSHLRGPWHTWCLGPYGATRRGGTVRVHRHGIDSRRRDDHARRQARVVDRLGNGRGEVRDGRGGAVGGPGIEGLRLRRRDGRRGWRRVGGAVSRVTGVAIQRGEDGGRAHARRLVRSPEATPTALPSHATPVERSQQVILLLLLEVLLLLLLEGGLAVRRVGRGRRGREGVVEGVVRLGCDDGRLLVGLRCRGGLGQERREERRVEVGLLVAVLLLAVEHRGSGGQAGERRGGRRASRAERRSRARCGSFAPSTAADSRALVNQLQMGQRTTK